jgi:hypothetical protein
VGQLPERIVERYRSRTATTEAPRPLRGPGAELQRSFVPDRSEDLELILGDTPQPPCERGSPTEAMAVFFLVLVTLGIPGTPVPTSVA